MLKDTAQSAGVCGELEKGEFCVMGSILNQMADMKGRRVLSVVAAILSLKLLAGFGVGDGLSRSAVNPSLGA